MMSRVVGTGVKYWVLSPRHQNLNTATERELSFSREQCLEPRVELGCLMPSVC